MLVEREMFLAAQHYAPIVDAIRRMAETYAPVHPRVADLGCGTGHYLSALAESAEATQLLAADVSPEAVRMAVRSSPGAVGAVFDLWQPLPLRNAAADVILNVFAPRNPKEFARVLSPGGVYIGVVPTAEHLRELHAAGLTLNVPEGKRESVLAALKETGDFTERATEDVTFTLDLEPQDVLQLIGMGPSAHHQGNSDKTSALPRRITVSVTVIVAQRGPHMAA